MKKLMAVLMALLLALCSVVSVNAESEDEFYWPGMTVEDFTVTLADGTDATLSTLLETHKAVLINIWATWCQPCCVELPYMNQAYDEYKDEIAVLCLSPYDDNASIAAFMEENGLTLPMGYDSVGLTERVVWDGYPTTIVVDQTGTYIYYECGYMPSKAAFVNLFETILDEDREPGTVLEEISAPEYEGELPTEEDLSAALNLENGSLAFTTPDGAWPFLPAENGAVNSNEEVDSTEAVVETKVNVQAGDVLTFTYSLTNPDVLDGLAVYLNDTRVAYLMGPSEGTRTVAFPAAGEYTVRFSYEKDDNEDSDEDTATLSQVAVLTGDEAAAALAQMPVYPHTLTGTALSMTVADTSAQEIVFHDPTGIIAQAFEGVTFYLVPQDTATVRVEIGEDIDPTVAFVLGDFDNEYHFLSESCHDGVYEATVTLSGEELGGYNDTYVYLVDDVVGDYENQTMIIIFKSEENLNAFCLEDVTGQYGDESNPCTWSYADGGEASTAETAQSAEPQYTIRVVDENGAPVTGVMVNVCTDTLCSPAMVDANGEHTFTGEAYAYVIHVLTVPEGYAFDTSTAFVMPEEGGELVITMPHA